MEAKTKRELFLDFKKFHQDNPAIYKLFELFTKQAIGKGFKNFGGDFIMQRIRWETAVETNGEDFKISNNMMAYYTRLFMSRNPEHDGFFRTCHIHMHLQSWIDSLNETDDQMSLF